MTPSIHGSTSNLHAGAEQSAPHESDNTGAGQFSQLAHGQTSRPIIPARINPNPQQQQTPAPPLRHTGPAQGDLRQHFQPSSPESSSSSGVGSMLSHFPEPPSGGRAPSQPLPPLDMSAINNNPRLRPPSTDSLSPPTPSPSTMQKYSNPNNLPGPEGVATHDNHTWDTFGHTEVPQGFSNEHQQVRQHMAATPGGQKYLAHLEQGPGRATSIVPYEAVGGRNEASGNRPIPDTVHNLTLPPAGRLEPQTRTNNDVVPPRTVVTYPVNQGLYNPNGGTNSAATVASHELRHAAQQPGSGNSDRPLGLWTDKSEQATITKGDNPLALRHGESLRDQHQGGILYETGSTTSTAPLHPTAGHEFRSSGPELQDRTAQLNDMQVNAAAPNATPESRLLYSDRTDIIGTASQRAGGLPPAPRPAERSPTEPTSSSSPSSVSEI